MTGNGTKSQVFLSFEESGLTPGPLLKGLYVTLKISGLSLIFAIFIGLSASLLRISDSLTGRVISFLYLETVRNTPLLIQLFFIYFVIALIFDTGRFASGVLALGLFEGAYITEIIRAGIESVAREQWEASYALGLSGYQQLRYIILPQAVRQILLPLAGQFISTIKDSAIVSVISIQELTFQGMELMSATYLTFEIWITVAMMYLILAISLSLITGHLEKHLRNKANL